MTSQFQSAFWKINLIHTGTLSVKWSDSQIGYCGEEPIVLQIVIFNMIGWCKTDFGLDEGIKPEKVKNH